MTVGWRGLVFTHASFLLTSMGPDSKATENSVEYGLKPRFCSEVMILVVCI